MDVKAGLLHIRLFQKIRSNSEEQYFLKFLAKQNYANICTKEKKYATDKDLAQFTKADLEQRILHVTGSLRRYVEKRKYNKRIDVIPIIISLFSLAISVYSLHVSLDKGPKNVSIVSWPLQRKPHSRLKKRIIYGKGYPDLSQSLCRTQCNYQRSQ